MDNIVVLNNPLYRIGDCILYDKNLYKVILNNQEFKNSFLYIFSLYLQKQSSKQVGLMGDIIPYQITVNSRINLAAQIIIQLVNTRIFKIPPSNALVIHLRLGDSLKEDNKNSKRILPRKEQLINYINNFKGNKIIFVTAYNYGLTLNNSEKEELQKKSEEFLNSILTQINNKYNVSFQSSKNIDEDFIFLCTARNLLITSQSGFGEIAKKINKILYKSA